MNKQEISKLQIDLSKINAVGRKYFDLFDKHIPVGINGNILIYDISNADCIVNIIRKNPNAKYFIYGNSFVNEAIRCINEWDITFLDETFDLYNIDMKFDCIVMNPPYSRNLHLKILAEAIKHLKDDNSVCVNLSPVRWLQDPIAKWKNQGDFKRFETSISTKLETIDIIKAANAQNIFSHTVMNIDLGVYKCKNNGNYTCYKDISKDPIIDKCIQYVISHNPIIDNDKQDGWRVRMPMITGGRSGGSGDRTKTWNGLLNFGKLLAFYNGKFADGRWWYECYMKNQYSKTTPYITRSIAFNNNNEAENFIHQFNCKFIQYVTDKLLSDVHVTPDKVFWLGDAINPRTGLKGYEGEWTDDDFYKFFNITPDEQKIIEETMAKYK